MRRWSISADNCNAVTFQCIAAANRGETARTGAKRRYILVAPLRYLAANPTTQFSHPRSDASNSIFKMPS